MSNDGTGGQDDGETWPDDGDASADDAGNGTGQPTGTGNGTGQPTDTGGSVGQPTDTGGSVGQPTDTGGGAGQPGETSGHDQQQYQTGTGGQAAGTQQGTTAPASGGGSNDDLIAALASFVIPGLGNILNDDTERGVIILAIWVGWLVVGWGFGLFIFGSIIGALTLGIGFVLVMLVVSFVEFAIHAVAAVDAYRRSGVVDNVTGKVNDIRGN